MSKIFWMDCETSGLDDDEASIVEFAAIIEIRGEIKETVFLSLNPFDGDPLNEKALAVSGKTVEEVMAPNRMKQFMFPGKLRDIMGRHVDKFNKSDKFILAGYNVRFDEQFLRKAFSKANDPYFGSWFFWPVIDVATYVAEKILKERLRLENYKLETVCKHYGIDFVAHNALDDITATRELYLKLNSSLVKN